MALPDTIASLLTRHAAGAASSTTCLASEKAYIHVYLTERLDSRQRHLYSAKKRLGLSVYHPVACRLAVSRQMVKDGVAHPNTNSPPEAIEFTSKILDVSGLGDNTYLAPGQLG